MTATVEVAVATSDCLAGARIHEDQRAGQPQSYRGMRGGATCYQGLQKARVKTRRETCLLPWTAHYAYSGSHSESSRGTVVHLVLRQPLDGSSLRQGLHVPNVESFLEESVRYRQSRVRLRLM